MKISILPFFLVLLSCTKPAEPATKTDTFKTGPSYVGVEAKLQPIVNEYKDLAIKHNIKFTKEVTIGFTKITEHTEEAKTIGYCTFAKGFREIDIDQEFFESASGDRKKILLFHELTHCYCGRDHDFSEKEVYLPKDIQAVVDSINRIPWYRRKPGFFLDECPVSIMYPHIVSDECIQEHKNAYLEEMFERCKPY